jgi:hypothetical protein
MDPVEPRTEMDFMRSSLSVIVHISGFRGLENAKFAKQYGIRCGWEPTERKWARFAEARNVTPAAVTS